MNITNNGKPKLRYKMVVRLWLIMMALTLFSVAFMWFAQIYLFEQNYIDSTISQAQSRLDPVMEDLRTEDLAHNDALVPQLSKATSGKMMLIDGDGELIALYSNGYQVSSTESTVWHIVKESEEYQQVLGGQQYKKVIEYDGRMFAIEIGIPVFYDGKPSSVILYYSLDEMNTMLEINRRQLVVLSLILTLISAALAALLSRYFTRPIRVIKEAVDSMAQGDLTATPGIKLNDELGQLSHSVEELGVALQRVDVLRKEVIANVSHELRAPLSLISGYAEMVRDINWKNDAKREGDLNLIISEARRMSEMVSDIMDYSQLQAGYVQLKKDCYNLYDIIESEVMHCEKNASEYQIAIGIKSTHTDIPVHVDALKISQALRNMLYNAINHTADGDTISVTIKEIADKKVRVSVINPGEPIPEEERQLIWERYQRSQHQGGRKKGTGIGLSIVSTFLNAHDMPYGVDCEDGLTTFWFECPIGKEES